MACPFVAVARLAPDSSKGAHTHPFFPSKWWRKCGDRRRRGGSDPSPVSPRLVKAPAANHPLPGGEGSDFCRGRAAPDFSYLLQGGEGGPRQAFSPAVAGRMRGFLPRPTTTNDFRSSSSALPPIFEAGECRGHCEGAKNGKRDAGLVLSTRHSALVTAFASACWFA